MSEDTIKNEKLAKMLGSLTDDERMNLKYISDKFKTLDEEGKKEFLAFTKARVREQIDLLKTEYGLTGWIAMHSQSLVIIAVLMIVLLFVFFGYKLYKSLSERERKREEKKKNKQMKKRK